MSHHPAWFASALAFALAMTLSPGPNNAMLAASGALHGYRRSLPHMAGVSLGFPVMLVLFALGLDAALAAHRPLAIGLRLIGCAILLQLAWRVASAPVTGDPRPDAPARDPRPDAPPRDPRPDAPPRDTSVNALPSDARPLGFVGAFLFQWVNPKAWLVCIGAVAAFTTPGPGKLHDALLLAAVFLCITPFVVSFWTATGIGAARLLRTRRLRRGFNLAMAGLLVASLVPLLGVA